MQRLRKGENSMDANEADMKTQKLLGIRKDVAAMEARASHGLKIDSYRNRIDGESEEVQGES